MCVAVDLSQKSIQIAIEDKQGTLVKESKIGKNEDLLLGDLKDINTHVVMESGYNDQFPYDLLKKYKYKIKVTQPFIHIHVGYCPDLAIIRHYERIYTRRGKSKEKITTVLKKLRQIYKKRV